MGNAILTNGLMTGVSETTPNNNYDYQTASPIRKPAGGGSAGEIQWLLYFARPFPLKATITSARIVMYSQATAQTGTLSLVASRLKASVSFTKITWNTRPTTFYTGTASVSKTGPVTTGTEWAIDVTAMMQSVSLGDPWYGFKISTTTLNPGLVFYGPTHTSVDFRPRLEVTWSDAPAKPVGLAPAGGRAVSGTKPIFRCDYIDVSGETEMQSIQLQMVWGTGTFAAPYFDTWTVPSSTPELDLNNTFSHSESVTTTNASTTVTGAAGTFSSGDVSATIVATGIPGGATITAYTSSTTVTISAAATASATVAATISKSGPSLAEGTIYNWRVRVQDMAGLWSLWSDPETVQRDIKGTLTLTNPSSGTPTVEETTPPISWTFTGETQTSYQLTIQETTDTGQVRQWTTGKKTSTVTTVTLPSGVINSPDSTYQATLRIWDAKQRETVPGDPAYTEVVRTFTYVPTATVTATTSPTATPAYPYPRVTIGWQRATAPDSFTILRNRKVIAANLVPATYLVSGTTYAYTDYSAQPQTTLTYEVQAIVNGKASASNPTVTTTLASAGMWLADLDRTNEVLIMGRDDRPGTYGELSEAVEVVGASEVVLVTQSMRGLEGTVTGELHSNMMGLSTTAAQWRNKLLAIKAKVGRRCWLTLGDTTIQCVVRNIAVSPRPTTPLSFKVSFDFYQVGTLQAGYVPSL